MRCGFCTLTVAIILTTVAAQGWAENSLARHLTDYGLPVMGMGIVADGLSKDGKAQKTILNGAEALAATEGVVEVLKSTVRERRPNGGERTSFPSDHASEAFALATVMAENHPKQKWYWYLLASGIAWSRVDVRAHHTHDVAAGALLGHIIADEVVEYNTDRHRHSGGVTLLQKSW